MENYLDNTLEHGQNMHAIGKEYGYVSAIEDFALAMQRFDIHGQDIEAIKKIAAELKAEREQIRVVKLAESDSTEVLNMVAQAIAEPIIESK
jgi:hypothetical protein